MTFGGTVAEDAFDSSRRVGGRAWSAPGPPGAPLPRRRRPGRRCPRPPRPRFPLDSCPALPAAARPRGRDWPGQAGTAMSGSPPSSRSAGIISPVSATHHGQSRTCRASRLRHSGLGSPSLPLPVIAARLGHGGTRRSAPHNHARRDQPFLHARDADGGVRGRQVERQREVGPGGACRPPPATPPASTCPLLVIEPAGCLGRLPGAGPTGRAARCVSVGEVGLGAAPTPPSAAAPAGPRYGVADLPDRDRHQPGPERGRVPQLADAADGAQHGLLHDVVHVRVAVHGPADDVVDQRQVRGRQDVKSAAGRRAARRRTVATSAGRSPMGFASRPRRHHRSAPDNGKSGRRNVLSAGAAARLRYGANARREDAGDVRPAWSAGSADGGGAAVRCADDGGGAAQRHHADGGLRRPGRGRRGQRAWQRALGRRAATATGAASTGAATPRTASTALAAAAERSPGRPRRRPDALRPRRPPASFRLLSPGGLRATPFGGRRLTASGDVRQPDVADASGSRPRPTRAPRSRPPAGCCPPGRASPSPPRTT